MQPFEQLLEEAATAHGHLCPGQVLGVRMAMLGCKLLGINEPKSREERKKLIVYVEIDRCATDAISSVTGCKLGKRSLKWLDYGLMAATFVNLQSGEAYRIIALEDSRELAKSYKPEIEDRHKQQLEAYKVMPDHELFSIQKVKVEVSALDLPGPSTYRTTCQKCGVSIQNGREIIISGVILCLPCSGKAYFQIQDTNSNYPI